MAALTALIGTGALEAQGVAARSFSPGGNVWRKVGGYSRSMGLPSVAGGPVSRVWFDASGSLLARLPSGQVIESRENEAWQPSAAPVPGRASTSVAEPPEPGARIVGASTANVVYASGAHLWRSENGGRTWRNQTAWKGASLLGGAINDVALDSSSPDRVAVATSTGVWLSQDGGLSWSGLNESLPALPIRRILATPQSSTGLLIGIEETPSVLSAWEWMPGRRDGWVESASGQLGQEEEWKSAISRAAGASVVTAASRGQVLAGGGLDGRLWTSIDGGVNWRAFDPGPSHGAVQKIWISPDGRALLASLAGAGPDGQGRVLRSLNGGQYWDDLSANLPARIAYAVAADSATGTIYAATERGVFLTLNSLLAPAPATAWVPFAAGLPQAPARDIALDPSGHHLFAAIDGYGVFAAIAPHRSLSPQMASAADFGMRAAAPGALLTLIGARLQSATVDSAVAPVLAAADTESQVQLPFDAAGDSLRLRLNWGAGDVEVGLPLREASPAILVDREGTPMLLDADSGLQSDLASPLRPGSRLQILATGLGRVEPAWPAGLAAPLEGAPRVVAPVRVFLNGQTAAVTRATLAPGYIGFYLVEIDVPALLDAGPAELWVEAAGAESNRVRVHVEQQ